jgi:predicted transcriptional regulator
LFISREEKERRIIDLYYNRGKTIRDIIKELRVSPNYVSAILKREEEKNNNIVTNNQQQSSSALAANAYELFSKDKRPVEVAVSLNILEPEVTRMFIEYCRLRRLHKFYLAYKELGDEGIGYFVKLYKLAKKEGWGIEKVVHVVDIAGDKLPYMESLYGQVKDEVDKMQRTIQHLSNDIHALEYKISLLDKTAFSSEQECRRIKQELCELIDKKDRIEKLIANIQSNNNEGYSKLKHIVKENVKAVLAENKQVISISFAALIQTLKSNLEMTKLIYNTPKGNGGEQHNDNNNIIKYLESNKDSLLGLVEKNYENIVEALTNDSITNTSSNLTLSLSSSSTISNPFDQTGTYRKEEPERFHNNKGNIAD